MARVARLDHPSLVDPRRGAVQAANRSRLTPGAGPHGLALRRARPGEAALVERIGTDTYREHFADFWAPTGLAGFLARQFDPATLAAELEGDEVRYELACVGDRVVGFAKTLRARPVPTQAAQRGRELQKIYFEAAATGVGYGAALLAHVEAIARDEGEPCIWLQVLETNTRALRFYARAGFAATGRLEFAADRGPAAMQVMVRELRAQSRSKR